MDFQRPRKLLKRLCLTAIYNGRYASTNTSYLRNVLLIELTRTSYVPFYVLDVKRVNDETVPNSNDRYGYKTPRRIGSEDEDFDNTHYLVYDLDSGKIVDFASPLNIFYYNSDEEYSFDLLSEVHINWNS